MSSQSWWRRHHLQPLLQPDCYQQTWVHAGQVERHPCTCALQRGETAWTEQDTMYMGSAMTGTPLPLCVCTPLTSALNGSHPAPTFPTSVFVLHGLLSRSDIPHGPMHSHPGHSHWANPMPSPSIALPWNHKEVVWPSLNSPPDSFHTSFRSSSAFLPCTRVVCLYTLSPFFCWWKPRGHLKYQFIFLFMKILCMYYTLTRIGGEWTNTEGSKGTSFQWQEP